MDIEIQEKNSGVDLLEQFEFTTNNDIEFVDITKKISYNNPFC